EGVVASERRPDIHLPQDVADEAAHVDAVGVPAEHAIHDLERQPVVSSAHLLDVGRAAHFPHRPLELPGQGIESRADDQAFDEVSGAHPGRLPAGCPHRTATSRRWDLEAMHLAVPANATWTTTDLRGRPENE